MFIIVIVMIEIDVFGGNCGVVNVIFVLSRTCSLSVHILWRHLSELCSLLSHT